MRGTDPNGPYYFPRSEGANSKPTRSIRPYFARMPVFPRFSQLVTEEFYRKARQSLKPDGMLFQLSQTCCSTTADLALVSRTVLNIFPLVRDAPAVAGRNLVVRF